MRCGELETYRHRAQYYETDKMGVVHHSNYIRWFEEARVDFMEKSGYGYDRMERDGIISPVIGVACDYKSPVRFADTVEVRVHIAEITGARLVIRYEVTDAEAGTLRATGETRHCFLGAGGRPVSIKKTNPMFYETLLKYCESL